jgi:ATP-dependent RNA helicase DeaD
VKHSFDTFGLHPQLVQAVAERGYTAPTPIQTSLIPVLLSGRDVIGQAQTGTGKTAAFALPTLHRLAENESRGEVRALVLVPTRELAMQVAAAIHTYGQALGARVLPVYGGQPYGRQVDRLRKGVDVVVGTPGRLLDLIRQGALDLSTVQTVVLDEADEMLSMGFAEDLEAILEATPSDRQTALLSATLPHGIRGLADRYLNNPERCAVGTESKTAAAIDQRYVVVKGAEKTAALARFLEAEEVTSALVFTHTRASVAKLAGELADLGYDAEPISGELAQNARQDVLARFRAGRVKLLVATDVAARGLDIDHVSHVFNYDLPRDPEVYVHRVGRTGRAGKTGVAIALVNPGQRSLLSRIEGYTKQSIAPVRLPTPAEIASLREERLIASLEERLAGGPSAETLRLATTLAARGHDPIAVAAAALALAAPEHREIAPVSGGSFGSASREARPPRDFADRPKGGSKGGPKGQRSDHEAGMVRLALAAGRDASVQPSQVVSAIARHADIPGREIGKILIQGDRTLVDVPERFVPQVLAKTGTYRIGKRVLEIERA